MKSYVAVQKKMLTIIYALWKKNEAFEENYGLKKHTGEQAPVSPLGYCKDKKLKITCFCK